MNLNKKTLKTFKIKADQRVKDDLKQAKEFLKSRRAGLDKEFLIDYRASLKSLQINPFFHIRYDNIGCLPFEVFKYMIHFSIDENNSTVFVHAVISTYQDHKQNWLYSI
jgi:hypothetical protein